MFKLDCPGKLIRIILVPYGLLIRTTQVKPELELMLFTAVIKTVVWAKNCEQCIKNRHGYLPW